MLKKLIGIRATTALLVTSLMWNPAYLAVPPSHGISFAQSALYRHKPTFEEQALALEGLTPRRSVFLRGPRSLYAYRRKADLLRHPTKLPDDIPRRDLDKAFIQYEEEPNQLKADLKKLAARRGGFVIPPQSLAPQVYNDHLELQPLGLLGILATPPDPYKVEFERLQHRLRELLADAVRKDVPEERFYVEYGSLLENLHFLDSFHLTLAGIRAGSKFRVKGRNFDKLWRQEVQYAKETVRYRQSMEFQWNGNVAFLKEFTPCIAALLMPSTREDVSRFSGLKLNYGNRLPVRTELAHVTLAYVRGIKERDPLNPKKYRRRVSARHMRWIEQALLKLEQETQNQKKPRFQVWQITEIAVTASENVEKVVKRKSVSFLVSQRYQELIEWGKKKLAKAWGLSGPRELDGLNALSKSLLGELDMVRGLFAHVNLRNVRALLVAIGDGSIQPEEVLEFIRHGQKIHSVARYVNGRPILHITAVHDQPALLLAISRKLDRSKYSVIGISQSQIFKTYDPPGAIVAIDIEMDKTLPPRHLVQINEWLSQIPDIGLTAPSGSNSGNVKATLYADLPRKTRVAGLTSQRTRLLEGLRKLHPNASVISLELIRDQKGSHLKLRVEVPKGLVKKLPQQLSLAVGKKGSVTFVKKTTTVIRRRGEGRLARSS